MSLPLALSHLVWIQLNPGKFTQHRIVAYEALLALDPALAELTPEEAWDRVRAMCEEKG